MSKLFNTLSDVLTPYANKINLHSEEIEEIQGDVSDVKADLANVERFEYKYPFVDGLEFVETITSSASVRYNFSNSVLNGLYLCSVEMASDDYTFDVYIKSGAQGFMSLSNQNSNIIYACNAKINFYINPSASAGHKLHIYKINEGEALSLMASSAAYLYPLTINVDSYQYGMRINSLDVIPQPTGTSIVSSEVFNYNGKFRVHLADSTYGLAVQIFNRETRSKEKDSGWKSDNYEFIVPPKQCFVIVLKMSDGSAINIEDIPSELVSIEALEIVKRTEYTNRDFELLSEKVDSVPIYDIGAIASDRIHTLRELRNTSPVYDHLFVNDGANSIIPHESLYHLRLSKALGYRIIEANTTATSDGVIVVNHFVSGKFGNYFHHVDGVTDISNIGVSTVTWSWIVENVRYNSTIPKYRTRPSRLEEFLEECNRQNMIPFVSASVSGAIAMADKYMGHYNYICYGGTREICPYGIIFAWNTTNTTKEQILATCDAIGSPMIYGLGNPQAFTDEELLEIVETLHAKGYAVGTSYQDTNWAKYRGMGFDFYGSQTMLNRIEDGNVCNYSTIFGWDDFNLTGSPTNDDNVLTFANSGTIIPKLSVNIYPVSGYDLEIVFNGQIIVTNTLGTTKTFTSDGSSPVFCAYPVLNGSPNVTINVSANTVVYDLYFKANRFY